MQWQKLSLRATNSQAKSEADLKLFNATLGPVRHNQSLDSYSKKDGEDQWFQIILKHRVFWVVSSLYWLASTKLNQLPNVDRGMGKKEKERRNPVYYCLPCKSLLERVDRAFVTYEAYILSTTVQARVRTRWFGGQWQQHCKMVTKLIFAGQITGSISLSDFNLDYLITIVCTDQKHFSLSLSTTTSALLSNAYFL